MMRPTTHIILSKAASMLKTGALCHAVLVVGDRALFCGTGVPAGEGVEWASLCDACDDEDRTYCGEDEGGQCLREWADCDGHHAGVAADPEQEKESADAKPCGAFLSSDVLVHNG